MAKRYQHRIGVRAEICFDLILDVCAPAPEQFCQAVAEALRQTADVDGGFRLKVLPGGTVLSRLGQRKPRSGARLYARRVRRRSLYCVEIGSIQ